MMGCVQMRDLLICLLSTSTTCLIRGWPASILSALQADGDKTGGRKVAQLDPVQFFKTYTGNYPSNADIIHLGKLGGADQPESIGAYHPAQIEKLSLGNTPAAKGHVIFSPFNRDRSAAGQQASQTFEFEGNTLTLSFPNIGEPEVDFFRPTVTEFYAGRVWYAGVPSNLNAGDVFFSQSMTDIENAGKCYQEQDPTAEDFNDLLDTDGGVIHIADMGRVLKMLTLGQDLVLVASNGIWAISGGTGANFTATSFTVRKVTDIGTISGDSVVEAENALFYWATGGIYAVTSGQIDDVLQVQRISRDTIQTFYDNIGDGPRAYSRGFYDSFNQKIFWFYSGDGNYDAITFRFNYNKALIYDLTVNAFYTYTISDLEANTPMIAAMTRKEPGTEEAVEFDVVNGNFDVVDGADDVCQTIAFPQFADTKIKLLTFVTDGSNTVAQYTFSEFKNRDFVDWAVYDNLISVLQRNGADYTSYIQTGFDNFGDPLPTKSITHVTSYFNRTEDGYTTDENDELQFTNPSGALVQTRWEWTDTDVGRWTQQDDAYRLRRVYIPDDASDPFDYGETVIKTKLRMRGKGQSFSIRYEICSGQRHAVAWLWR